jgi:hypothetical protein
MPSPQHEALVTLFRNCPTLAPGLLRTRLEVPAFSEARIESADLTDLQPAEYRGDLVVVLRNEAQAVLGVIVEVQLRRDLHKRMSWPAYAVNLRQRLGCDTCVLVFSPDEETARWANLPIQLGAGSVFQPVAVGPAGMPRVVDPEQARREPELAVLSAMAHGRGDVTLAIQIALAAGAASKLLDDARAVLYFDLVMASLGSAAQQELLRMDPAKYEFQSEFAKHYIQIGRAEGEAEGKAEGEARGKAEGEARGKAEGEAKGEARGRAAMLLKLLAVKELGPLEPQTLARIQGASLEELEAWAVRVLRANTLADVFDD